MYFLSTRRGAVVTDRHCVFSVSASESSVYLVDVDGDGLEDVLVGVVPLELYADYLELLPGRSMREVCSMLGVFSCV